MMSGIPKCVDKKKSTKNVSTSEYWLSCTFYHNHNKYWFQYSFGVHIKREKFQNQKVLKYLVNDLHGNYQFYEEIFFKNHVTKNNYLVSRNI